MFRTALAAIAALFSTAMAQADYTESLTGLSSNSKTLDMVYVQGGTYQRGCSDGDSQCVEGEKPVHKVTLSGYYIGKYELTNAQWKAVMNDGSADNKPKTSITWYDAIAFTCELNKKTGKKYRLATDAEFEFAARGGTKTKNYRYSGSNNADDVAWHSGNAGGGYGAKDVGTKAANELGIYDMSGNVYEWTLDSWQSNYSSGDKTNPIYRPAAHTQKTRRGGSYDQPATSSRVSARKIRSIEGKDGSIGLRLARSVSDNEPAAQINPCGITQPFPTGAKIGFRDLRIATADDEAWIYDMSEYNSGMGYVLRLSSTGAAKYSMIITYNGTQMVTEQASGEWYTLNGHSLYIVPSSGTEKKYIYLPLCRETCDNLSMMPEAGMPGRYERMKLSDFTGAEKVTLPSIASPKTPETLANGKTNIDMANPPKTGHDPRVKEGTGYAWIQDNVKMGAGGTHRYRKDFESDQDMRFIVWDPPSTTLLAHGPWFTVDNTFLRVNDPNGATYDYLYTVTVNKDTLYHISFQSYEPGDFRMFMKTRDSDVPAGSEPAANATTYNQGASKYIPPSVNGTGAPSSPSTSISSSSKASSSSVAASAGSSSSTSSSSAVLVSSSSKASSSSAVVSSSSFAEVLPSSSSEEVSSSSYNDETPILSQIATSNLAVQIKNGVNLQVVSDAAVEIYSIKGNLINRQNYKSGIYTLSLTNLPRGIYLIKVRFGGSDMKILRVPVM
jgi:formylglycine-generating enzyme required for sulfatase activity